MRVWEVDDLKALPGDIVREQDFIIRLRHLQRQGTACAVINLSFGALPALYAETEKREAIIRALAPLMTEAKAQLHVMSQGDVFIITPDQSAGRTAVLTAIARVLAAHQLDDATILKLQQSFSMPQDYAAVRERANHYVEAARASAQIGAANPSPEQALHGDQVRGPLTPWALDQIVKLFGTIDVRRYVRSQTIYRFGAPGWTAAGAEYFVSVEELRRERFPRLDIRTPERLFMELCSELDHRLLNAFAEQPSSLASGPINLNIAVESVLGTAFAKFTHAIPAPQRAQMTLEINRGELLMNFEATLAAIATLKREGYQVALDALHPAMLPYLNCAAFDVSFFKIRCGKEMIEQAQSPAVLQALRNLPRDKVILYRCDSDAALEFGKIIGASLFQGWYIDDLASGDKTA